MKLFNHFLFLTAVAIAIFGNLSCKKPSEEKLRLPMKEQFENSLRHVWQNKEVYASQMLADMEDPSGWTVDGIGEISYTSERSKEGSKSMRFQTPMRDEEYIKRAMEEEGKSGGRPGGRTRAVLTFDQPQDWSEFNRISLWLYVHPSEMRTISLSLSFRCEDAPSSFTDPRSNTVIQHTIPEQWNHVIWEIPNLQRDKVTEFAISQSSRGHDPGMEVIVTYDIDQIELQLVDAEKYEGWEVAEGKIAFNHVGYRPAQTKTAIASDLTVSEFQLIDVLSGNEVFTNSIKPISNDRGKFQVLDFSNFHTQGKYIIQAGDIKTRPFIISDTLWKQPLLKAMNFYYCERCGFDIPGIHPVCHKDWQGIHNDKTKIINGGWHDAGDLSQATYRTITGIYAMLEFINQLDPRDTDAAMKELIVEEALWGLDWLLKTRFGDGFRINWSKMRMYTDGIIGNDDDVVTPAGNIPWENFLAAGTEAFAYRVFKDKKPELAKEFLQAAEEDWEAAAKSQSDWETLERPGFFTSFRAGNTYVTVSWGIISSLHLHKATGEKKYSDRAIEYGRLLMRLQEQLFLDGIPITGYFYTGTEKKSICNYSHGAYEEASLLALKGLCETFLDHEDWINWYGAITLHSEYFIKRGAEYTAPYYMIPASVYRRSEILNIPDTVARQEMLSQFLDGTRFTDEYYLHCFPVWIGRGYHGGTGVQLSETMALTAAMQVRNDPAGEDLASKQLQWIFGGNPFSQSLMYGEGYDFAPLYGPNPGDIVGAIPVGMDCMHNDEPYWDGTNIWTYKEIWVLPNNRFLFNMAYLGMPGLVQGNIQSSDLSTISFTEQKTGMKKSISVSADGTFQAVLPSGNYLIEYGDSHKAFTVVSGGNYNVILDPSHDIELTAKVKNQNTVENTVQIEVVAEGKGIHNLDIRVFNGTVSEPSKSIDLGEGKKINLNWDIQINEMESPWVCVIIPDGDFTWKNELTGTFE
ncbi:glycoside hydrolase family 9 protein [Bacteroidota bacterium]